MKNLKNYIILVLFVSILLMPITFHLIDIQESTKNCELNFGYLNSAGSWVLAPFTINPYGTGDYTWLGANETDWCSGAGTELDPWIIENVTIDSGGLSGCLEIGQSDDYFIVRNCTFKNSYPNYGIHSWSTSNGIVEDCTFLNNSYSVYITGSSQNNTIQGNYFYNRSSVKLVGSTTCINNTVSNNIFVNRLGIIPTALSIQGYNNKIINNTVDNFFFGIYLNYANQTLIKSNTFISSWRGISIGGNGFNATVFNNTIRDNHNDYGVLTEGNGSVIYRNTFINNNVNAKDSGHFNRWDNGVIGNYWDNYTGVDADDDGIGDSPYRLHDSGGSQDNFPIWDDGDDINPTISINSPSGGSLFGTDAPTYSLNIFDLNLNQSWYTLNGTATRYFFTPTNGINVVAINETGWDSFSDGLMSMAFYVNDSGGNLVSVSNAIIKDISDPTISINTPSGGSLFGDDAPMYSLNIFDLNLNQSWYTLNGTATRYFFTPTNGINVVAINETGWDSFSDGSMSMTFYVNDSGGNLASALNVVTKDVNNPTISINTPSGGSLFGDDAPTYNLNIFDLNLNQSWYTLNGTATRYFFTPINGINVVAINETGWDSFSDGSMSMTFYVNDSGGNLASVSNAIIKDISDPTIALNSPLGGTTFGSNAPEFNLTIYDLHLLDAWYTIGSSVTPHSFSPINGFNIIQINESSWDDLPEGSIAINFFVNDTVGNIHTIQVIINKDLPSSSPEPGIPFGNYYILFMGIGIISLLVIVSRKRKLINS